LVNFGPQTKKL